PDSRPSQVSNKRPATRIVTFKDGSSQAVKGSRAAPPTGARHSSPSNKVSTKKEKSAISAEKKKVYAPKPKEKDQTVPSSERGTGMKPARGTCKIKRSTKMKKGKRTSPDREKPGCVQKGEAAPKPKPAVPGDKSPSQLHNDLELMTSRLSRHSMKPWLNYHTLQYGLSCDFPTLTNVPRCCESDLCILPDSMEAPDPRPTSERLDSAQTCDLARPDTADAAREADAADAADAADVADVAGESCGADQCSVPWAQARASDDDVKPVHADEAQEERRQCAVSPMDPSSGGSSEGCEGGVPRDDGTAELRGACTDWCGLQSYGSFAGRPSWVWEALKHSATWEGHNCTATQIVSDDQV
ncbi:hypothetical protein EGW08_006115, partial [Elysia chlorotica]